MIWTIRFLCLSRFVLLLAGFAALALAQARPSSSPVQPGSNEWAFTTGGGARIAGSTREDRFWTMQLRWGRVLTAPRGPGLLHGSLEYAFEVVPGFRHGTIGSGRFAQDLRRRLQPSSAAIQLWRRKSPRTESRSFFPGGEAGRCSPPTPSRPEPPSSTSPRRAAWVSTGCAGTAQASSSASATITSQTPAASRPTPATMPFTSTAASPGGANSAPLALLLATRRSSLLYCPLWARSSGDRASAFKLGAHPGK